MGRLTTAIRAFWAALWNGETARALRNTLEGAPEEEAAEQPEGGTAEPPAGAPDAVYTLTLLQREGRLIDFLMEDIDGYEDDQIGAAVRRIHEGCRAVLDEHFGLEPIRSESEGSSVSVPESFDPTHIRLTGDVGGQPPFEGELRHRGWRATNVNLPDRHSRLDPAVVCPAEVEL